MIMEHSAHHVDLLAADGKIIGSKPRKDINKQTDIYHGVYTFLVTPEGSLALTRIAQQDDLPNLYAGTYGIPVATIRRTGESTKAAATRSIAKELLVTGVTPISLGDVFTTLRDGRKGKVSAFYFVGEPPLKYSTKDIAELITTSSQQLTHDLHHTPEAFAPTLHVAWQHFKQALPV